MRRKKLNGYRESAGDPQTTLHAEKRYAQRVLDLKVQDEASFKANRKLRDRCQAGLIRIYWEAQEMLQRMDEPDTLYIFRNTRELVLRRNTIVTIKVNKTPFSGLASAKLRRRVYGPLRGITYLNALLKSA